MMVKEMRKDLQKADHIIPVRLGLFITSIIAVSCVLGDIAMAADRGNLAVGIGRSQVKQQKSTRGPRPNRPNLRQLRSPAQKFTEVEIVISEDLALADISALLRAPGSNLEVLNNPRRVRVQLPVNEIEAIVEQGAEVTILRNFVLFEGSAVKANGLDSDVTVLGSCSGTYEYGENDFNVDIPSNGGFTGSVIDLSGVSGGYTATCIDVHYEITSSWIGFVYAELSDEDYGSFTYSLVDYVNGPINQTKTGISAFNGKAVDQTWILWVREDYSSGGGYIDYWWIKVYYDAAPGYCGASGDCYEYISRVQAGTIDNSSGCDGYADYTATSTEMEIGTGYPITVTNGDPYSSDKCGIWVDWNQDMDFDDAGETIAVSGNPSIGPYTATITPPADANLGDTRMRIRIIDSDFDTLSSCGISSYGEVEDYTVSVITSIPSHVTVSGYVRTTGIYGLKDVLMSASTGELATTDIYGYYELTFSNPWTGSITPTKENWTFSPSVKSYFSIASDFTNVDFTAIALAIRYWGGSGTEASPYRIQTAAHMQELGSNPADWNKHFELIAHINLSGYTDEQFNMIGLFSWTGMSIPFTGVFDGKDYSISRFNYTHSSVKQEFIGIFSYINHANAEVKNLNVSRVDVDGGEYGVAEGGLAGLLESGTISNCSVEMGTVTGKSFDTGGLVGQVWGGTINECYSSLEVVCSDGTAGGLVGSNSGTIADCKSDCDVTGREGVGGLVGDNYGSGNIIRSYSLSNVNGYQIIGGLVGENNGGITQSRSHGNVIGTNSDIGGLVGRNINGLIYDCYSTASVTGGGNCGGLVGLNWSTSEPTIISNCYATGAVSGTFRGGLVGYDISGTITNSFWDIDLGGPDNGIGTPKTTSLMQAQSTFIGAGWDFVEETVNGTNDIWKLYHTESYPLLAWEKYSGGTGTPSDPYLIYIAEEMQAIGAHPEDWDKCFKLMDDIDLSAYTGTQFNMIGYHEGFSDIDNDPFDGIFDGNGHTISNFTYTSSGTNYIGLFSSTNQICNAEIRDLTLTGVNINAGSGDYVGALVGTFNGIIVNCSASGSITGDRYVGGLVGQAWGGTLYDCYTTGTVTGNENVGGMVGHLFIGELFNCYATASVTGGTQAGGLVGDNGLARIATCYATGAVSGTSDVGGLVGFDGDEGVYTNCFWDSTVNTGLSGIGNRTDPNVTGQSTTDMQTQTTYTDANWDFVGEMANGPDDDWGMPDSGGYPVLWWQLASLPELPQLFSGGSGQPGNPYLISTAAELNSIGHNPKLMDKHFRMTGDIDLTDVDFSMIGGHSCQFAGAFDGDGHVISNFTLMPDPFGLWLGLFQVVALDGRIENLGLVDPNVGNNSMLCSCVGSLAASNFGTITNCFVTGDVSSYYIAGAIAGRNCGTISDCYAATSVFGTNLTGGLLGINHWGSVVNCISTGAVTGEYTAGGMVGTNFRGTISTSCATGDVSGTRFIGGLVGENIGDISDSYATGDVSADSYSGGLLGLNFGYISPASISNCYSAGLVSGDSKMGGLVGGHLFGTYTSCFWDNDINPDVNGVGNTYEDPNITGKTTAEMYTQSTFTDSFWDFAGETANGTEDIWTILEHLDYPRLASQSLLLVDLDLDHLWMYQNLPVQTGSTLAATVSITDDPLGNSSYSYEWEFILPSDVNTAPITVAGGGTNDPNCTFAALGCDDPNGLSDSGQTFKVRVTVTGDDYGNTSIAEAEFGIALLGDVSNDGVVNVADRSIVNAFWRTGSAGAFTLRDCDVNCDGVVNVADRSIANAIWRGTLGQNLVGSPCPFR